MMSRGCLPLSPEAESAEPLDFVGLDASLDGGAGVESEYADGGMDSA
jgi:hypothetical protein